MTEQNGNLKIVGPKNQFPEVTLIEQAKSGYLMLAVEIDRRPPIGFFVQSKPKLQLTRELKALAENIRSDGSVLDATVFKALIIPPGRGAFLKERPNVEIARFDLVLLIELDTVESAQNFKTTKQWTNAVAMARKVALKTVSFSASNVRRIGPVDHSRDGIFLFNYFYADNLNVNLDVWKYTAGWFQDQTGLDNSTVLLPQQSPNLPYTIINHCRWNKLRDILPALIFNKTFRSFVLANFQANNTAAMPILYQLA